MEQKTTVLIMQALGHDARLSLFRLLVTAGEDGLNIGQIRENLNIPASTLAHHLACLVKANVVSQHQNGRETINIANFKLVEHMANYLFNDCCKGVKI